MAILTSTDQAVQKKRCPLGKDPVIVGRHPDCDIHIDDASVSRHHAQVTFEGGQYFLHDLNSRNGTFLNGITRQRVIQLLREAGVEVVERRITYDDLTEADELFATGNYSKVVPCTQLDGRALPRGPMFRETRDMYFSYADAC